MLAGIDGSCVGINNLVDLMFIGPCIVVIVEE